MAENTDNLVLEHLRYIRERVDRIDMNVRDLQIRVANIEEGQAALNRRFDHLDLRVDRVERRLEIVGTE